MKREFIVVGVLVAIGFSLPAAAQDSPSPMAALPPAALQQIEALSGQGGPLQGMSGRINRMTDPNAGKRPGDEKLGCEQIKAEFDDTKKKYAAQQAKQEAAEPTVEANAREAQAEASGPGAIAKGFLGGLGAVAAQPRAPATPTTKSSRPRPSPRSLASRRCRCSSPRRPKPARRSRTAAGR